MKKKGKTSPPVIAEKLLANFFPDCERSSLLGDYEELFIDLVEEKNRIIAVLWYWLQIVITIPPYIYDSLKWRFVMIKNYLKVTFRSLIKNKGFDLHDQLKRYIRWWKFGHFSSTGECFDIGATIKKALTHFKNKGGPLYSTDPYSAGNGSIMRLVPVPLFFDYPFPSLPYFGQAQHTCEQSQSPRQE